MFLRDPSVVAGETNVAGVAQPMRLAGLASGDAAPVQWSVKARPVDFFDVKGDVEALFAPRAARFVAAKHPALHPGRSARVEIDGTPVGFVGELHPRWRQAYDLPAAPMLFELDLAPLLTRDLPVNLPVPRQQPVWRDISVLADESVTHDALMAAIGLARGGLVRSARLFDVWKPASGPGPRSLSVRLELRGEEATLTDAQVDAAVAEVLQALAQRLGARLRA